jgi:hypothetical protein
MQLPPQLGYLPHTPCLATYHAYLRHQATRQNGNPRRKSGKKIHFAGQQQQRLFRKRTFPNRENPQQRRLQLYQHHEYAMSAQNSNPPVKRFDRTMPCHAISVNVRARPCQLLQSSALFPPRGTCHHRTPKPCYARAGKVTSPQVGQICGVRLELQVPSPKSRSFHGIQVKVQRQ